MNDNDFWLTVWKLVGGVVCFAIAAMSGCTGYESSLVKDMVSNGTPPMSARCAIGAINLDKVMCIGRDVK